jgi:cell division protein FtsW
MTLISRSDRGALARWWFTVDKLLLTCVLLLMAAGVIVNLAASPTVAARLDLEPLHFFNRHLAYLVPAALILLFTSFLGERSARWTALAVLIIGLILMIATLMIGAEVKGARRWIDFGVVNLQPSEFVKPAFVVIAAWLLSERTKRPDVPGHAIAVALFAMILALLLLQPDFGQAALLSAVFAIMLVIYGLPWTMLMGLSALALAGLGFAYEAFPHVASRIDRFLSPGTGDTFQVDTALQAFYNGGLFGTGPGGGTAKRILPDAHSDFIFSVLGEEFGFLAGIVLVLLFAFIVMRVLLRALEERDAFSALALAGLISVFGLQAIINMAVNLSLMPAKGMTLPFISYGGSSLLSMAFAMGLVLVFGRRRPRTELNSPVVSGQLG